MEQHTSSTQLHYGYLQLNLQPDQWFTVFEARVFQTLTLPVSSTGINSTTTPLNAVHHPDQSEDSQDEDDVQDLPTGVTSRYDRTGIIIYKDRKPLLSQDGNSFDCALIHRQIFSIISVTEMKQLQPDFRAELTIVAMRAEMTMMVSNLESEEMKH